MRYRWLAITLVVSACGGEVASSDAGSAPAPSEPPVTAAPPSTVPVPTAATTVVPPPTAPATTAAQIDPRFAPLVGRWAHYDVVAYEDDTLKTLVISYGFNDLSEVDGRLIDQASFCFSEQRTDQPIETSLSDAATQAIRPPPTPVEVDEIDDTLRVRRAATPTPVGIRLDEPADEALPDDPNDPRIVDDDGDGDPGITVEIRVDDDLTGELYIARREIFAYQAYLVAPDRLEGTVTDDSEQLVLGASDPVFFTDTDWVQHPDLTKSPIILRRVDDDWDCERLAMERDTLFPPTPEVDW